MQCVNCGEELNETANFCPKCGIKITTTDSKNTCPKCGAETKDGAKFCSECGEPLPVIEEKEVPKENTDEAGKKAWEDLKVAVREKFKIDEEDENSLIIDFDLGEEVIYPLFLAKLENSVLSEIWLEIISPIGELNSLDLEEVCNFVGEKVCGGVIAIENDSFALRTCMLMSKIDKDAVFRTMEIICSTACELNAKFVDNK